MNKTGRELTRRGLTLGGLTLGGMAAVAGLALPRGVRAAGNAPVRVGLMLPYSGTFAKLGESITLAFEMYLAERDGKLGGRSVTQVQRCRVRRRVHHVEFHWLVFSLSASTLGHSARSASMPGSGAIRIAGTCGSKQIADATKGHRRGSDRVHYRACNA